MLLHIIGPPGAGKTSLAAAMGINAMHGEAAQNAISRAQNLIEAMNSCGFNIPTPAQLPHLVYTYMFDIKASSPDFGFRQSWTLDATRLGFRTEDFVPQFVYPASTLIIDEFQTVWNSRNWTEFPANVSRWFEQSRKLMLDIIIISQRNGIIDANVRELCEVTRIKNMQVKYNKNHEVSRVVWSLEKWESYADYKKTKHGKPDSFVFDGNIFDCYDTAAGFERFFAGVSANPDSFLPIPHAAVDLSPQGIEAYVKKNPIKLKAKKEEQ